MVWSKQSREWANLAFSVTAIAAAAIAAFELAMIRAGTASQYEALVRWIHLPVWVLVVSFVCFVRLYLRAGRAWLGSDARTDDWIERRQFDRVIEAVPPAGAAW